MGQIIKHECIALVTPLMHVSLFVGANGKLHIANNPGIALLIIERVSFQRPDNPNFAANVQENDDEKCLDVRTKSDDGLKSARVRKSANSTRQQD